MAATPSINRILYIPGVSLETARAIKEKMKYWESLPEWSRPHPESVLRAIDKLLGTHGVEYTPAGSGKRSPAFWYCNAGDTYNETVLYTLGKGFGVGCWGDIVERGNYD